MARALCNGYLNLQNVTLRSKGGDVFVVPHLRESVGFELLINGEYECDTRQFLLQSLSLGGTFVDVGANIGALTIPAARRVGSSGRVVVIEASPYVFGYLEENVRMNGISNVVSIGCAVHDHDEAEVSFWDAPTDHFGMGSLAPQFHPDATKIVARTLDGLLAKEAVDHVDVLKVDVEGFESSVFRGARRLLTGPRPPVVLFEFCDWAEARGVEAVGDAQEFLRDLGYQILRLSRQGSSGTPLENTLTEGFAMLIASRSERPLLC